MIGEFGFAKAYAAGIFVDYFAALQQANMNGVEHRIHTGRNPPARGREGLDKSDMTWVV